MKKVIILSGENHNNGIYFNVLSQLICIFERNNKKIESIDIWNIKKNSAEDSNFSKKRFKEYIDEKTTDKKGNKNIMDRVDGIKIATDLINCKSYSSSDDLLKALDDVLDKENNKEELIIDVTPTKNDLLVGVSSLCALRQKEKYLFYFNFLKKPDYKNDNTLWLNLSENIDYQYIDILSSKCQYTLDVQKQIYKLIEDRKETNKYKYYDKSVKFMYGVGQSLIASCIYTVIVVAIVLSTQDKFNIIDIFTNLFK